MSNLTVAAASTATNAPKAAPTASEAAREADKSAAAGPAATDNGLAAAAGKEIVFVTEGSKFAPVLVLRGPAKLRWIWADGTESAEARPTKDFGSRGQRRQRLLVEPWSELQRINIGYDGSDGGDPGIERVANQEVSAVSGLELVAPHLEYWCSSFNPIPALDFRHFHRLHTIEGFKMAQLREVRLEDTPQLRRACFEESGIRSLDVSESPALADVRGALAKLTDIRFGKAGPKLWHICIRDNPQLNSPRLFADGAKFPQIAELYVWKTNQRGTLAIHSTHPDRPVEIFAAQNQYDTVDLTGALKSRSGTALVDVSFNQLTKLTITGCEQVKTLRAGHNRLSTAAVDAILQEIDAWKTEGGQIDLIGNAPPSSKGQMHRRALEGRRWKVDVDSP